MHNSVHVTKVTKNLAKYTLKTPHLNAAEFLHQKIAKLRCSYYIVFYSIWTWNTIQLVLELLFSTSWVTFLPSISSAKDGNSYW